MTDKYAEWDAAYVLGALSLSDRREFEEHLRGCLPCSAAVSELAGMPGLLRQLDVEDFVQPELATDEPRLPTSLLPRLARAQRNRQLRRRAILGSAVAALAVAAASVTIIVMGPGAPMPRPEASTVELSAVQPSNLSASVTFVEQKWGTRLDTKCTYHGGGYASTKPALYSLWVTSSDGTSSEVATWESSAGSTVTPTATTMLDKTQIASVEIRSDDGAVLLASDVKLG